MIEETTTDANGEFRLRGLQPNHQYKLSVVLPTGEYERVEPEFITVTPQQKDIENMDFIFFKKPTRFDIMGQIILPNREDLKNLTVVLQKV